MLVTLYELPLSKRYVKSSMVRTPAFFRVANMYSRPLNRSIVSRPGINFHEAAGAHLVPSVS